MPAADPSQIPVFVAQRSTADAQPKSAMDGCMKKTADVKQPQARLSKTQDPVWEGGMRSQTEGRCMCMEKGGMIPWCRT